MLQVRHSTHTRLLLVFVSPPVFSSAWSFHPCLSGWTGRSWSFTQQQYFAGQSWWLRKLRTNQHRPVPAPFRTLISYQALQLRLLSSEPHSSLQSSTGGKARLRPRDWISARRWWSFFLPVLRLPLCSLLSSQPPSLDIRLSIHPSLVGLFAAAFFCFSVHSQYDLIPPPVF